MKNKLLYILAFLALIVPFACDNKDDVLTENALEGGLINPSTTSVNYVVGDGAAYSFDLVLNHGKTSQSAISKVELYKSVFRGAVAFSDPEKEGDSIPARWSNEILEETINIADSNTKNISATPLNYASLILDLLINGEALPASDGEMNIGDYFNFRIENTLGDGRVVEQAYDIKIAVSTRFAGKYRLAEGAYWRIGELSDEGSYWPAETLIESVDAKTYKMNGLAAWADNELYFQIEDDGSITYPEKWNGKAQILNGNPLITCLTNPSDMTHVHCDNTNFIVKDDVDGKDRLVMSFGYYTSGSGPREFYQVMEKIVE